MIATALFQSIITGSNLSPDAQGHIDSFSDLRAIFDPYRKRFWLATTGAYRACVKVRRQMPEGILDAARQPEADDHRRRRLGRRGSDPRLVPLLVGRRCRLGDDERSLPRRGHGRLSELGVNAVTVDVSVKVADATRAYPHVALYDANDMAAGKGPTIDGWSLYPLFKDDSTCNGGFRNPDGSCPGPIIQPTLAHPDPGGSSSSAAMDQRALVIWKVTDLLKPTQLVQGVEVPMPTAFSDPSDRPQKGAPVANTIDDEQPGHGRPQVGLAAVPVSGRR